MLWIYSPARSFIVIERNRFSEKDLKEFEQLNDDWKNSKAIKGREHEWEKNYELKFFIQLVKQQINEDSIPAK